MGVLISESNYVYSVHHRLQETVDGTSYSSQILAWNWGDRWFYSSAIYILRSINHFLDYKITPYLNEQNGHFFVPVLVLSWGRVGAIAASLM